MDKEDILISAYAQLPSGTVSHKVFGVLALVFVIDIKSGTIKEVGCTLSTRLAEQFVIRQFIGKSIDKGPQPMIDQLKDTYQGSAQKAIITALREISAKYEAIRKQLSRVPGV